MAERHLRPYPKNDVRYVMTIDEEIEQVKTVTLDDVRKFYNDFYGIARAEFVAVGDFDAETVPKQVSSLFDGWKSKQKYARVETPYQEVAVANQSVETPDKANATFIAVQPIKMDDSNPDYPALVLANYMLGGGFLNSRLPARIRVKDGLSYGVGSQLAVPAKDDGGEFIAYAISAPQNTAKVETDFVEEMRRAVDGGFTDTEVAAAKSGWLQSRQVSRGQDNELTTRLASQTFWGRTMKWDADLESRVSSLKTADINEALRKYVKLDKISYFKAGDFAKAKSSAEAAPPATTK
jgi:zinc protease